MLKSNKDERGRYPRCTSQVNCAAATCCKVSLSLSLSLSPSVHGHAGLVALGISDVDVHRGPQNVLLGPGAVGHGVPEDVTRSGLRGRGWGRGPRLHGFPVREGGKNRARQRGRVTLFISVDVNRWFEPGEPGCEVCRRNIK